MERSVAYDMWEKAHIEHVKAAIQLQAAVTELDQALRLLNRARTKRDKAIKKERGEGVWVEEVTSTHIILTDGFRVQKDV